MSPSYRILVVDDEDGLRVSLAANLELSGFEVFEAHDGAQAIECVKNNDIDLVITDFKMPGLNGVDTFREIRKIRPGMVVLLMTGFALEKLVEEALGEGVHAIVHKPFDMDHLLNIVSRAVAGHVILVVDDDAVQARTIVEVLREVGLRAEAANDGPSAVQLVRDEKVDVCVLDLVMPGMDGLETFAEIRRVDPSVIVVAVSGDAVPRMMHQVMTMGGYACMRKPIDVLALVRAIGRARGESARP